MNIDEARSNSQSEGTSGIDELRTQWKPILLCSLAVLVVLGITWMSLGRHSRSESPDNKVATNAPAAAAPTLPMAWHLDQSKWPRTNVPAHGDSAHVPIPAGYHIVFAGAGFRTHCVYPDGHDEAVPCSNGSIAGYVRNETGEQLSVAYAYATPDEK